MKLYTITVALAAFPHLCDGLANPFQDIFSPLRRGDDKASSNEKTPEKLLEELKLEASTKPVLAGARIEKIPSLIAQSLPAVFRGASGVFALDYRFSIIQKDPSKYSYLTIGDFQTQESGLCLTPALPLILYETEDCPYCRAVREACSMLSLKVNIRPSSKQSRIFRAQLNNKFGKNIKPPFLIDPNTGREFSNWYGILDYLFLKYGRGQIPWLLQNKNAVLVTGYLGLTLARLGGCPPDRVSMAPELPLVLWAYEGSPFCKGVRNTLDALELEHKVVYVPRGSANRQELFEKMGRFQVPFLEDPNTGVTLFESDAIIEYIEKMYAVDLRVKYM